MLFLRVPVAGPQWRQDFTARIEYEATLVERRLEHREPGAPRARRRPARPQDAPPRAGRRSPIRLPIRTLPSLAEPA